MNLDDLREMADGLHPRLAASPDGIVSRLDQVLGQGTWRLWQNVAKHIKYLTSSTGSRRDHPLTVADVRELVRMVGK